MTSKNVIVPREPNEAMLDRAVAMALNVTIDSEYRWTDYMRHLYKTMLKGEPQLFEEEMIGMVARALCLHDDPENLYDFEWELYIDEAIVALKALGLIND